MPSEQDAPKLHVGLTAIKPGDGAIVAMYGGKDYSKRQLNDSTQAIMQGGSTFKVFGLLAALQKDISTKTRFNGHSPQYFPEFADSKNPRGRVPNFANEQYGTIDLRRALAHSVNTIFAQLNIKLAAPGTSATGVKDAAILAGLPTNTVGLGANMNNILGTASPHVIDMANAYATVAAQGQKATPYIISKVTFPDGKNDYKVKKQLTPAFDKKVTADVTDAMERVVTEGTGARARALDRPAAGKTGTTDKTFAVWFDGFTPQLSAAVGIYKGKEGQEPVTVKNGDLISSGGIPVDIWTAFMKGALQGQKVMDFPPRAGVGDSSVPPPPTTVPPTTVPPPTVPPPTVPPPTVPPPTVPPPTVPPPTVRPTTVPPTTPAVGAPIALPVLPGGGTGPHP